MSRVHLCRSRLFQIEVDLIIGVLAVVRAALIGIFIFIIGINRCQRRIICRVPSKSSIIIHSPGQNPIIMRESSGMNSSNSNMHYSNIFS